MLSEIDQLVRQVEHCFNTKSPIPLPKALSQLTQFKGKVKFRFRMDYKCSCHGYFFKQNKSHEDLRDSNALQIVVILSAITVCVLISLQYLIEMDLLIIIVVLAVSLKNDQIKQ